MGVESRTWPMALVALALAQGCATAAREVGEEATEGALSTLAGEGEEARTSGPGREAPAAEGGAGLDSSSAAVEIGEGVAAGIVGRLARPRQLEDVEAVAERAGAAFARGLAGELAGQVGPEGEGPLAASLSAAGGRLAAGALRGAAGELGTAFPECGGPDSGACIRRQIQELGAAGARGAVRGAGVWPFVAAAAGGAAVALLIVAAAGGLGSWRTARRLEVRRTGA